MISGPYFMINLMLNKESEIYVQITKNLLTLSLEIIDVKKFHIRLK